MQETKRPRGRPPTGRKRNIKMSFFVTEEERQEIKEKAISQEKSVADYLIDLVKKN